MQKFILSLFLICSLMCMLMIDMSPTYRGMSGLRLVFDVELKLASVFLGPCTTSCATTFLVKKLSSSFCESKRLICRKITGLILTIYV